MAEQLDVHGYPCSPRFLGKDETAWFYEQRKGLYICIEPVSGAGPSTVEIPWRKIEAALKRHRTAQRKRG